MSIWSFALSLSCSLALFDAGADVAPHVSLAGIAPSALPLTEAAKGLVVDQNIVPVAESRGTRIAAPSFRELASWARREGQPTTVIAPVAKIFLLGDSEVPSLRLSYRIEKDDAIAVDLLRDQPGFVIVYKGSNDAVFWRVMADGSLVSTAYAGPGHPLAFVDSSRFAAKFAQVRDFFFDRMPSPPAQHQ
jgi:hypothetical protein